MTAHYLRVPSFPDFQPAHYGLDAERWAEEVFNDLTEGGHVLTTVPLPEGPTVPYSKGPVLGLCGGRFFGEVRRDDNRPDCLLLVVLWPADKKLTTVAPTRHKVDMNRFPESGKDSPRLDPVDALFPQVLKKSSPEKATSAMSSRPPVNKKKSPPKKPPAVGPSPPRAAFVEPSSELRAMVRNLDLDSIRRLCTEAPKILDKGDWRKLLKRLRSLYRQFNQSNITIKNLEGRDKLILNGSITPPHLDIELCKKIGEACDVRFFNRLGIANRHKKLLLDMLDLPVDTATTRRILWLTWLSEQEPRTLKEELHVVANHLFSVDNESDSHLDDLLLKTLQKVGERYNDVSLLVLKRKAENSNAPWNVIADWASNYVAGETVPPRPDHKTDIPKGSSALKSATKPIKRERVEEPDQADAINGSETDTHLAPDRALPERPTSPQSERDMLADWIIAQRLSISEVADEITKPMQEAMQVLRGETLDTSSLKILRNTLSELQKTSAAALHLIPTLEEIDPIITESETLVATLKQKLGRDPLSFLNQEVSLDALREVAHSEPLLSAIGALPDWAVPPLSDGLPEDSADRLLFRCLREEKFRQDMERLGEKVTHSDDDPGKLLESIPPPSSKLDAVNYLSDWVDQATMAALELARRLKHLNDRVSLEVAKAITEKVEAATDNESRLAALDEEELTLERIEKMLGEATTVTARQWDQARIGVRNRVAASPRDTMRVQKKLTISHNFVDRGGRRATATYVPYDDPDMPYGFVTVPLALESPMRVEVDLDLDLELKVLTNQRKDWPSEWKDPAPRHLRVRANEWKEVDEHFQWTFRATIPIRDPSTERADRMLRVIPQCHHDGENVLSDAPGPLAWDQLKTFRGMPDLDWPDGVKPDYVKEHPVGGQARASEILKRLRSGSSFAVVAPRRFGKSTLLDYIAREAEQDESGECKLLVLPPISCTSYRENREAVWEAVHRHLVERGAAGLTTTEYGNVPSTNALKRAREIAWKTGYQGIVILFDEAQLFFAGRDGPSVGDRLKDVLEREWTRQPKEKLASVQIGLVGLPSLRDRAGTNIMAALRTIESQELRSEELNRILLAVSQDQLQTTRAARQELAHRTGNNLFVLRTMVERIHALLNEQKRLWFNDRDVKNVFSDARQSLEKGSEREIGNYLQDSLNEADSINEWQPKPCYPLAVALASVGQSAQGERRIDLAVEAVQDWCATLSGSEVSFEYTEERREADLEALRELGVYNDRFHSELLEGYLRYVAGANFPKEEKDKQAIIRCGVERIREPEPLEPVVEGGQAKIYCFERDKTMYAWRQIELPDSRAHKIFLTTKEALHKLSDLSPHEKGTRYLYDLQHVGISEDGYGVEVYRWINGIPLDELTGTFSKEAVVDVGFKIGQAIKLIHDHDVLHRDISPRNIILTDDAIPVLVDFGLARATNRKMSTALGGEEAPPEVQGNSPNWTKAADIYGFGKTLRKLLRDEKKKAGPLHDLLKLCLSTDPKKRPDAGDLLNKLEMIRGNLRVNNIRNDAWQAILKVAEQPETNQQFQKLLSKFQPQFEGIAIGLYPRMIERCAEMSVFLDQTLEAFSGPNEELKLGSIKHKGLRNMDITGQGVEFAHFLRTEKSHFSRSKLREEKIQEFDTSNDQSMRVLISEVAKQIGRGLSLPQLVKVVETALAWPSTR